MKQGRFSNSQSDWNMPFRSGQGSIPGLAELKNGEYRVQFRRCLGILSGMASILHFHCYEKNLFLLERFPHFHSQVFQGKWFLNELHPFIKHPVMGDHIGCIARHVKGFNARVSLDQLG